MSDFITDLGYNTDHPDCVVLADAFISGAATVAMCSACYESIGVSGSDCSAAERTCFGGSPTADAANGTPDASQGSPDAMMSIDATTGDVNTCSDVCALAPIATPNQGGCTGDAVDALGYDTANLPCGILAASFASGTATPAECNACYNAIGITDPHCVSIHTICF